MVYAIGLKELWEVDKSVHKPGHVEHTLGYPLVRLEFLIFELPCYFREASRGRMVYICVT